MKFEINGTAWDIELVDEKDMKLEDEPPYCLGLTIYKSQTVKLLKGQANIIRTLKHELMHVWLYEYGHKQNEESTYTCENVCEIVASSNEFINKIVEKWNECSIRNK